MLAFYAPLKPPDHPMPSGDRRMARLLMRALGEAGYDPTLVSRFRSYDGSGDPARQGRLADLGGLVATRLLRRWQTTTRPVGWFTYHLYHKAPDWVGPAVSDSLGIPYFIAEASHAPKQADGPWNRGYVGAAAAIERADAVFCLNSNDRPCLVPLVAAPERLVSLPPFVDAEPYRTAAAGRQRHRAELAFELGIAGDHPWLLAVGMMRPGDKLASYRLLAQALHGLLHLEWRLLVVGDGPARPAVAASLQVLGPDRVVFAGERSAESLPAFYAAADLMVWPAVREAYGMALLEAQATGLPVRCRAIGWRSRGRRGWRDRLADAARRRGCAQDRRESTASRRRHAAGDGAGGAGSCGCPALGRGRRRHVARRDW